MRIWRSMIMGAILWCSLTSAYAVKTVIDNYVQLVKALELGDDVRAIIHFDNCLLTDHNLKELWARELDGASTRVNFTEYLHFNVRINGQFRNTVTTSMKRSVVLLTGEHLILFSRLSIFEENPALYTVEFYSPILHKKILTAEWQCDISNGHDENGLVLFDSP
jgi:hypothetical protein